MGVFVADLLCYGESINLWQHDIQYTQIEPVLLKGLYGFQTILTHDHLIAPLFQVVFGYETQVFVVFDIEDPILLVTAHHS